MHKYKYILKNVALLMFYEEGNALTHLKDTLIHLAKIAIAGFKILNVKMYLQPLM